MAIPGLPALGPGLIISVVDLVLVDVLGLLPGDMSQQWGLFLNDEAVVVADNVVSFEFKQDRRISSYPVEEGAFETYNKVAVPYDVRLRFSTGGSATRRQAMQESIDAIMDSLELFDAVTPTKVYQSLNPVHQDLRQTARNGVGLLVIDVFCQQIRVTANPQFASSGQSTTSSGTNITVRPAGGAASFGGINTPQSPSAAPQVSDGTVQPVTPTAAQQSAVDGVLAQSSLPF